MTKTISHKLEKHGDVRIDDYYWLRERDNPEVIEYLEAENERTREGMSHLEGLMDTLFTEIKDRIKDTDTSVPYRLRDYFYYSRYEEGKEYPIHCRKAGSLENPEEILLDVNELAGESQYFNVRGISVSASQNLLAFSTDTVGNRIYTTHIKDLESGEMLVDVIPEVTGAVAWAGDNRTFFYGRQDKQTLRSYRIYRHVLGRPNECDELIFEESDETFATSVFKTKSRKYILIISSQTTTTEYRYLQTDNPDGQFKVFHPRVRGHEYQLDHMGDRFYVLTNQDAVNFKLMTSHEQHTSADYWQELVPHRQEVLLENFELFNQHLVLEERKQGLTFLQIRPLNGDEPHYLDFGEPAYLAYVGNNMESDSQVLRYGYTSMTTPSSVYDYHMETREKTLLKREEVLGGFNAGDYQTERVWAPARDGKQVPISVVYRKDCRKPGANPLLLYGYGAYGSSMDATFSPARLSLLDRGFVYAIAHIRGGQELGRQWYDEGRLQHKMNSFTDFIDCAEHLAAQAYGDKNRLYAMGGSAGGLLMGAVMNMRPDLFDGVVAVVPFVDVITTMLDPDIPLTTGEYDEWGNPNVAEDYFYIKSYSPYDNVTAQDYPHLLVTTGLHDSQVQYWEPAKWVARLRAIKTDNHRLLMKTDMEVGHAGATGRFKQYRDTALMYAFILDLAGV